MIAEQDLVVRPARAGDMPEACALLRELGLAWPSAADTAALQRAIDGLWTNDPFFTMYGGPVFHGWVMLHHDRIVGFFGSVPRAYLLQGRPLPVSVASNWGVRKEYRAFTRLLADAYFEQNPIDLKLVTTAIAPTGRIFERHGGHRAPVARLDHVYVVPFRPGRLALLAAKPSWRRMLRAPCAVLDRIPLWRPGAGRMPDVALQETPADALPGDYQHFWEQVAARANGLVAFRDAPTIAWVYGSGRFGRRKRIFLLRYRNDGPIVAYASLIEEPVARDPTFKRWKLGDLLGLTDEARSTMLRSIIHFAWRSGCHALEFQLPGSIERRHIPAFTLARKAPAFPVHYHCASESTTATLRDPRNWPISPFDGDTLLG